MNPSMPRPPSDGDRPRLRTPTARADRFARVMALAEEQAGVVSRPQIYQLGMSRHEVAAHVRARRWQPVRRQVIATFTGTPTQDAQLWAAVLEAGPRAQLDGTASLLASGLAHFTIDAIRVTVPRGYRVRRSPGVDVRQTRRWTAGDRVPSGIPRTRVEVAAVRAALWAVSDKQAALILTMTVQQKLTTTDRIARELLRVRRHRRRLFLHNVVLDLLGGVRSLGEAEFAKACRDRGLPEPTRQVLRKDRNGTTYLDALWEDWDVVVEIDGIQHTWADRVVGDALRQNGVTLDGKTVLRLPLLGLRSCPDEFFDQIGEALSRAGCPLARPRP